MISLIVLITITSFVYLAAFAILYTWLNDEKNPGLEYYTEGFLTAIYLTAIFFEVICYLLIY